jgi:nitrous oxide reductase accessory protein NosL
MNLQQRLGIAVVIIMVSIIAPMLICGNVRAADESCQYCGMERAKYGHSWVMIEHEDGTMCGMCSVHCASMDIALHTDKPIKRITVGDYNTKKQIDAHNAYWVIGGDIPGVMTARAKWAFESKAAAESFMAKHGGKSATFDEAIKAAFEDMYNDVQMIQKKREKSLKKEGKS